jgi:hypothetical protein
MASASVGVLQGSATPRRSYQREIRREQASVAAGGLDDRRGLGHVLDHRIHLGRMSLEKSVEKGPVLS